MRNKASIVRKTVLGSLLALCVAPAAFAQTASTTNGLGQSWPNATDVSSSPNWHVYVFQLNGIKYVQVNDLNGTVHAAVGALSGSNFVLPVGTDAQRVSTDSSSTPSSSGTVYNDGSTAVTATPQTDGTTAFKVQSLNACPTTGCSGNGGS